MVIDYDVFFGGVDYDLCVVLSVLCFVYMKIMMQGMVQCVIFWDCIVELFKVDFDQLKVLIIQFESECVVVIGCFF